VQNSGWSQGPAAARQTYVLGRSWLGGHAPELPVQKAGAWQSPVEGLQTVVLGKNESAGHATDVPVQYSAGSHGPVEARHNVVLAKNVALHCDVPLHDCVPHDVFGQLIAIPLQTPA